MKHDAEAFVPIDLELRFALFGLQMALRVSFSTREMERVFSDARSDDVSAREYLFHDSPLAAVTGFVDEHEPGDIRLRLRHRDASALLPQIIEAAHYEVIRINRFNEQTRHT